MEPDYRVRTYDISDATKRIQLAALVGNWMPENQIWFDDEGKTLLRGRLLSDYSDQEWRAFLGEYWKGLTNAGQTE